jgi:hypothetical protein
MYVATVIPPKRCHISDYVEAADFSGIFVTVYQHYDEKPGALDILGESSNYRICEQI